jgi:hypothetical protein
MYYIQFRYFTFYLQVLTFLDILYLLNIEFLLSKFIHIQILKIKQNYII